MGFEAAFEKLMGHEGGYSNHPNDPGGETMYGVTARVARIAGYTGAMIDLPRETAMAIAKKLYWNPYQCDQFAPAIAFALFDTAYNGGKPAHWLQQALGVTADGIIGAQTIGAARAADPAAVAMAFYARRLLYLTELDAWPSFGRGWTRRIANNLMMGAP